MGEEVYHLYFIKDDSTPLQNAAFEAVSGYENLLPEWIEGNAACQRFPDTTPKNCCLIMGKFCGPFYEHFKALGTSIYGPQVLLDYLREQKPLPNVSHPLFSTALRGAHVTVTSVTGQEREKLFNSIELLHGESSRDLTDSVNVLIAPKVGSKKYIVGASRGVSVVRPDWIEEAWRLSEILDPLDMMQPDILVKFRLPIFSHLVICVSGLSLEERKEVSKIVSANGGRYSGEMKVGETTHLLVKCAGGVKYNFAKKWKIRIVSVRWLTDSVSKGYALDEAEYPVPENSGTRTKGGTSTPSSSIYPNDPSVLADISAITDATCLKVDDTCVSCFKDLTNQDVPGRKSPIKTQFLRDCVILLYGCNSSELASLSKIVSTSGAILCSKISDKVTESLTHVVLGADSKNIPPSNIEPGVFYVTSDWLISCNESGSRLPEKDYQAPFLSGTETKDIGDGKEGQATENPVDADELQLINQYFGDGGMAEVDDFLSLNTKTEAKKTSISLPKPAAVGEPASNMQANSTSSVTNATLAGGDIPTDLVSGLFTGFSFRVDSEFSKYQSPGLIESIAMEGGVVNDDPAAPSDYTICPYVIRSLIRDSNPVTEYWINNCLNSKKLLLQELDSEIGFRPIHIPISTPLPLSGCVISLSGYVGVERTFLTNFGRALGAIVQECFLRKPVPSRGLTASTHLVTAKPDGRKWPAAQQWGLPAVSCGWLYACAKAGKRLPEADFLVKQTDTVSATESSDLTHQSAVQTSAAALLTNAAFPNGASRPSLTFRESEKTPQQQPNRQSTGLQGLKTPTWVTDDARLQTPSTLGSADAKLHISPPLSEQVSRCLKAALSKTSQLPKRNLSSTDFNDANCGRTGILAGVIVCVAKSLGERQVAINNLVKELGGDFRWTFDPQVCTHMIADRCLPSLLTASPAPGSLLSATALPPDVSLALQHGKLVITPDWVHACQRAGRRLPEADFLYQSPSGVPVGSDGAIENMVKTSSLLGDVTRRLESVLSNMVMAPTAAGIADSDARLSEAGAESGAPYASTITRRSRRPRRAPGTVAAMEDLPSLPSSGSASNLAICDLAHPTQSLQVRWQYDDTVDMNPRIPSPQAATENSNDSCHSNQIASNAKRKTEMAPPAAVNVPKARLFSLSGLTQEERERYANVIHELGGELDNGLAVSEATTHLILHAPTRSEKFLMSLAAGKWVLHKSYLDACSAASTWLSETAYEWGGPGTEPLLVQLSPAPTASGSGALSASQLRDLAKAARYWRIAGGRAFAGWRVIFGPGCDRETSFRRIIETGGGEILANCPPYPPPDQVTHAFYKKRHSRSAASAAAQDVLPSGYEWLRFDFLCAHLTGAGEASRAEFLFKSDGLSSPPSKRPRL
ncbi:DNA topoisomerase 2-binding protein 1 [Sparganum proliferum]